MIYARIVIGEQLSLAHMPFTHALGVVVLVHTSIVRRLSTAQDPHQCVHPNDSMGVKAARLPRPRKGDVLSVYRA